MSALLHPPVLVDPPGQLSAEQRRRLLATVARAVERAAAATAGEGEAAPAWAPATAATAPRSLGVLPPTTAAPRGEPRERVGPRSASDASREDAELPTFAIPSYDDQGRSHRLTLLRTDDAAGGDEIVEERFPRRLVARATGNVYVYAGGSPYVRAGNLARAMKWGRALFGGRGYAVLQPIEPDPRAPFLTVPLTRPLALRDLGRPGTARADGNAPIGGAGAAVFSSEDYTTVIFETSDDIPIFSGSPTARWNDVTIVRELNAIPVSELNLRKEDTARAGEAVLRTHPGFDATVETLVDFDRTMFAAMPWERRAEFLRILVDAWTAEREEIAIIEIIHATRTEGELEAIFSLLRRRGVYRRLFRDLDGRVFELLTMLGEFRAGAAPTWQYLAGVLADVGVISPAGVAFGDDDPLLSIRRTAEGVEQWVVGMVEGVVMLFAHPDLVIEGLGHLAELAWTFERARWGDRDAQAIVAQMAQQIGRRIALALRGLDYADELGTGITSRGRGEHASADILGRMKAMIVAEVASWFIGLGEVRAIIATGGELAERVAALARAFAALRALGRIGASVGDAARLERVLLALARAVEIEDSARALRLLEVLPESHVGAMRQIAAHAEVPADASIDALRLALADRPELLGQVDRLADAVRASGRLEARAAAGGHALADVLPGFHRLLREGRFAPGELARLLDDVPAERLGELMRTVDFIPADRFAHWTAEQLTRLGARPRAMEFLREAGGEAFATAFAHEGADWLRMDSFLDGLAAHRPRYPAPDDWQRFLERLGRGEQAAFDEVAETLHTQRVAQSRAAGLLDPYIRSRLQARGRGHLLEALDALPPGANRQRFVDQLATLGEKELDGVEQLYRHSSSGPFQSEVDAFGALHTLETWSPADRADLLGLLADVGPHSTSGLDTVLHNIFQRTVRTAGTEVRGVTGAFGQLYAARTALRRYGVTRVEFELRIAGREVDIVGHGPREIHFEVKTNIDNPATLIEPEVRYDLVRYARDEYRGLQYLFHPNSGPQLRGLGQRMRGWFTSRPEILAGLNREGIALRDALNAFDRWLAAGGLRTYEF